MCLCVCVWWEGAGGGVGERGALGVIWDREMDRAKREHTKFLEEVLLIRVIN